MTSRTSGNSTGRRETSDEAALPRGLDRARRVVRPDVADRLAGGARRPGRPGRPGPCRSARARRRRRSRPAPPRPAPTPRAARPGPPPGSAGSPKSGQRSQRASQVTAGGSWPEQVQPEAPATARLERAGPGPGRGRAGPRAAAARPPPPGPTSPPGDVSREDRGSTAYAAHRVGRCEPAPDPPRALRPAGAGARARARRILARRGLGGPAAPGAGTTKTYRCPGCDQEIAPGTPHLVAWPADGINVGIDERRHWHRACWQNRLRRGPRGVRRTDP